MLPRQMSLWTWTHDHAGEGGVYVGWSSKSSVLLLCVAMQSSGLFGRLE